MNRNERIFQLEDARFLLIAACIFRLKLGFQLLVQPLDRRQRNTVGIYRGDGLVAVAQPERGAEILRDRAQVCRTGYLGDIAPGVERHRRKALED